MFVFFFNDTATTEIYTLSLHDALPILALSSCNDYLDTLPDDRAEVNTYKKASLLLVKAYPDISPDFLMEISSDNVTDNGRDRKSTRLNSSHANISYAVFCLKKKK